MKTVVGNLLKYASEKKLNIMLRYTEAVFIISVRPTFL